MNDDTWKRTFNSNAPGNPVALLEEKDDRAISKSLIGNLELDYNCLLYTSKPDKLNKGLITNAQDMMTGKIAGVSVISKGGAPGEGATIRIRGGSSLTAENDPLIVIDGLAMDNKGVKGLANPLSMVNPNDIESFTVLKDASATAIYGSRASNGVIIITTKKGQAGARPTISYDGNVSVSTVKSTVDVMDGDQFRPLRRR